MADGALAESDRVAETSRGPVCFSPVDTDDLRVLKSSGRQRAPWYLDETQVTLLKGTIDEATVAEDGLNEGTTDKHTVVELT